MIGVCRPAVLLVLGTATILAPLHPAERELALRQGIPARESSMAACSGSLSGDGRFVAFVSMTNLLATDTRLGADVYVINRDSLELTLETRSLNQSPSHGWSCHPRLSGNGRYLVFRSEASDLVTGTASSVTHIFLRDRLLGTTERLTNPDANHTSDAPVISDDGRVAAFESRATNLVPGPDANGFMPDVYVVRLGTKAVIRASVRSDGHQPADGASRSASLSGDGRFLAFASTADLEGRLDGPGRSSRESAIYLRDLVNGTTSCVSCFLIWAKGSASQPHLSADARFIAFAWQADPGEGSASTRTDIALHDRDAGTTTIITGHGNASSSHPQLSANGRYVAFESLASDLSCGRRCRPGTADENLLPDIYLFDRGSRQFTRLSGGPEEWWVPSVGVSLDREGTVVSFSSRQPLAVTDLTTDFDLFVRTITDRRSGSRGITAGVLASSLRSR